MNKRDRTRTSIIEAAATVCLDKGLYETSMEMVAAVASFHRRTLYRYFPQREDLLNEVVIYLLDNLNKFQISCFNKLSGPGIERFVAFLSDVTAYMEEHRAVVRFMGEFDFYFSENHNYVPPEDIRLRFIEAAHVTEDLIGKIIEKGVIDGSVVLPVDMNVFIPTVTTALWGTAQRIALMGNKIQDEFGVSGMEMVRCQINLYVNTIRRKDERIQPSR